MMPRQTKTAGRAYGDVQGPHASPTGSPCVPPLASCLGCAGCLRGGDTSSRNVSPIMQPALKSHPDQRQENPSGWDSGAGSGEGAHGAPLTLGVQDGCTTSSAGTPLTCCGRPDQRVAEPHAGGHLRVDGGHVVPHQLQHQQQDHADQPQHGIAHPVDRHRSRPGRPRAHTSAPRLPLPRESRLSRTLFSLSAKQRAPLLCFDILFKS